jgi:hypothetical protein
LLILTKKTGSSNNLLHSAGTEKDLYKITIVCLASLIPILNVYVFQALAKANKEANPNLAGAMQTIQTVLAPTLYCAEELCLILLLKDFRRTIRKFLGGIFCRQKNGNPNNSQNIIRVKPTSNGVMPTNSVP